MPGCRPHVAAVGHRRMPFCRLRLLPSLCVAVVAVCSRAAADPAAAVDHAWRFPDWSPPSALRSVHLGRDCHLTHGTVGVAVQPNLVYPHGAVVLCPERVSAIEREAPGAGRFFLAHEYGHLALHTRAEAAADRWAAAQLARSPNGPATLRAVLRHLLLRPRRFDARYGSNLDRALRIAQSGEMPVAAWPPLLRRFELRRRALVATHGAVRCWAQLPPGYANAADMILSVDGRTVGFLTVPTGVADDAPLLAGLAPGPHQIQLVGVWIYHREPDGRATELARDLAGTCVLARGRHQGLQLTLRLDDGGGLSVAAN